MIGRFQFVLFATCFFSHMTECSLKPAECVKLKISRAAFRLPSDFSVLSCAFLFTVGKNDGSVNGKKYFSWWVFIFGLLSS